MLESVGVEPPDEEAYRVLLSAPGCDIAELAKHLDRDEREVATTVERLERLGLLTTTADHPVRLLPTRPDVAVDALSPYGGPSSTGFAPRPACCSPRSGRRSSTARRIWSR